MRIKGDMLKEISFPELPLKFDLLPLKTQVSSIKIKMEVHIYLSFTVNLQMFYKD